MHLGNIFRWVQGVAFLEIPSEPPRKCATDRCLAGSRDAHHDGDQGSLRRLQTALLSARRRRRHLRVAAERYYLVPLARRAQPAGRGGRRAIRSFITPPPSRHPRESGGQDQATRPRPWIPGFAGTTMREISQTQSSGRRPRRRARLAGEGRSGFLRRRMKPPHPVEVLGVRAGPIGPGLGVDPGGSDGADRLGDVVGSEPAGEDHGTRTRSTMRRLIRQSCVTPRAPICRSDALWLSSSRKSATPS